MNADQCLQIVRDIYKNNKYYNLLSIEIDEVHCGEAILSMLIDAEKHTNQYGVVHGGALESLADVALGVVCATKGERVMTLSFNMNFIRNIHPGERAYAHARVCHHGRTTMVVEVDLYNAEKKTMGCVTATMFVRPDKYTQIPTSW